MIVEFEARDKPVLYIALTLLLKACEAAKKAMERIALATLPIDTLTERCEHASKWIGANSDQTTGELALAKDVPAPLADTMRTACWLYLDKLGKVEAAQVELLVETEETKERTAHLQELHAKLGDQVTMQFGENATMRGPRRIVEELART